MGDVSSSKRVKDDETRGNASHTLLTSALNRERSTVVPSNGMSRLKAEPHTDAVDQLNR